jgi:hypothetical protein
MEPKSGNTIKIEGLPYASVTKYQGTCMQTLHARRGVFTSDVDLNILMGYTV